MTKKNASINLIYWGMHHIIWVIDKLGYDYMVDWRNQMSQWLIELEKKCDWVGENQRSWKGGESSERKKNYQTDLCICGRMKTLDAFTCRDCYKNSSSKARDVSP